MGGESWRIWKKADIFLILKQANCSSVRLDRLREIVSDIPAYLGGGSDTCSTCLDK